jgi:hypothetical protein
MTKEEAISAWEKLLENNGANGKTAQARIANALEVLAWAAGELNRKLDAKPRKRAT